MELADAENLSEVTYCIGTELLLDMGAHASRKSREVGLDSFRYGVAEALDLLANDRGHVMVLNNLDRFAASDAHGFRQWTSDLVDVYNMRLGWYSYPTNPGYHLFDEDGPAWIVVLVGAQRTLEWAEKILEEANDAIVRSPHYWVFAWRVPVPILWVMPGGSSDDSH